MFSLTSYERKVLIFIGLLIFIGSLIRFFSIKSKIPQEVAASYTITNINTADLQELIKVPWIGEKLASEIIRYRYQHGIFKNEEDLKKVKGIGEKKLRLIRGYITF